MIGYVYIFGGDGIFKIGWSRNVERRVREVKKPHRYCRIIHVFGTDDPQKLEKALHKRYAKKRAHGEWFYLSADDIAFLQNSQVDELMGEVLTVNEATWQWMQEMDRLHLESMQERQKWEQERQKWEQEINTIKESIEQARVQCRSESIAGTKKPGIIRQFWSFFREGFTNARA